MVIECGVYLLMGQMPGKSSPFQRWCAQARTQTATTTAEIQRQSSEFREQDSTAAPGDTKPVEVKPERRDDAEAAGGPAAALIDAPRTAAQHTGSAAGRTTRVLCRRRRVVVAVIPIRTPIRDIPRHAQRTAPAYPTRKAPHRKCPTTGAFVRVVAALLLVPSVAPRIPPAIWTTSRILPLCLCWKFHTQLVAELFRIKPGYKHHRMILALVIALGHTPHHRPPLGNRHFCLPHPEARQLNTMGRLLACHKIAIRAQLLNRILDVLVGAPHLEATARNPDKLDCTAPTNDTSLYVVPVGSQAALGSGLRSAQPSTQGCLGTGLNPVSWSTWNES